MESTLKRTWAEIDLDHLTHNFKVIRRHVGDKVKLLGVVKADGYGHGAVEIAKRLEQLGAGYLAVSNIDECEELRDSGVTLPILMLGFTPADQTARILQLHMTQAVQSYDIAKEFSDRAIALGEKMTVHVKLDTGMGRLGFSCDEAHFDASLRDYGPGIPEEELPFVKQKFYKGSSKARGSGIGLAVCDEIVRLHGGTFDIANAEGGGAVVTISLPMS